MSKNFFQTSSLLTLIGLSLFSVSVKAMEEVVDHSSTVPLNMLKSAEISEQYQNLSHQQKLLSCKELSYAKLEEILLELSNIGNKMNSESSGKLLTYVNNIYPDLKRTNDETRIGQHNNEKKIWNVDLPISKYYRGKVKEINKTIEEVLEDLK